MRTNILACVLWFLVSPAWATDYWVATTGSDSEACNAVDSVEADPPTDPGTYKLTFASAVGCMVSGDRLIIKAGNYDNQEILNPPGGTSGNYTVIKGDPAGARPVIRPNQTYATRRAYRCTTASACQYVRIEYIETYHAYNHVSMGAVGTPAHHMEFINNKFCSTTHTAINIVATGSSMGGPYLYRGNEFCNTGEFYTPDLSSSTEYAPGHNTIYGVGDNSIIENNVFHDLGNAIGIWASDTTQINAIIRNNVFYNICREDLNSWIHPTSGSCSAVHISVAGGGHQIYKNIVYNSCSTGNEANKCVPFVTRSQAPSNVGMISNNTIYNLIDTNTPAIALFQAGSTTPDANVQNNIAYLAGTGFFFCTGCDGTHTNNTTSNPSFTNAAGGDFSLASGSAAINAGTNIGFSFNGSAPDQGAFETFVFATCAVEASTPTIVNITFTNNAAPPLLPASSITGFSAREDASAKTNSSVSRVGDNQVNLTVTAAFSSGTAIDISISGTNLTDSSLIGNTANQPFVQAVSNQSCTNNVAGAPSFVLTQARYEWHYVRGTEAAPLMVPAGLANTGEAENLSNIQVRASAEIRLRIAITCTTADCPATGFFLRYSRNSGTYTVVSDTFGADNIAFAGTGPDPDIPNSGTVTTCQLSTGGTCESGALVRTSSAIPTVTLATGAKTEIEYVIALDSDAVATDTYDFRIYKQDGSTVNAYTVTPRMTVIGAIGGMGF